MILVILLHCTFVRVYIFIMEKSSQSSVLTDPEKGRSSPDTPSILTATDPVPEKTFLTGPKLYLTLFSIVIVGFLITLDGSIVVTVRIDSCIFLTRR